MTSAVDIISPKPTARPEPSAKASSIDEDRASFADALDAETTETEATPSKETTKEPVAKETAAKENAAEEAVAKDEPSAPDANAAAQPTQPQQQPTPAVNSPEAILAGLIFTAPTDAPVAEAGAATPTIDAATNAGATQAAGSKPTAKPQPAAPQADAAAEETGEAVAHAANIAGKPAAPVQAAQAAPAATPAAGPAPLAGEERTSATVEAATTSNNTTATPATSTAADPTANKTQGAQTKIAQVFANPAAESAPDIKADAAAPSTTSTPLDGLANVRTSGADIARSAPAHTAMQNAPATTVQVYQRMVERFDGRAQRYEIRLDPAELGRVDVRIEVGADKKVHAVLAAHDSAALTDLMRGQRSLERALNDAGIDLAKDGIRFELSGDQGRNLAKDFNGNDGNGRSGNVWRGFNTIDVAVDAQTAAAARPWRSSARLDVVA